MSTNLYPGFRNPLLGSPRTELPKHVAIVGAGTIGPDIGYYFKTAIPGLTLSNVVITNGGGYKSTSDTEPDFTDVTNRIRARRS